MLDKYNLSIAGSYAPEMPTEWLPHILAQCKAQNKDFDAGSFAERSESYIKITYWMFDLLDRAIKIRDNESRTDNEVEEWCEKALHLYKYGLAPFEAIEGWAEDTFKDSYSLDERTTIYHIAGVLMDAFQNVFTSMVEKLATPRRQHYTILKNSEFIANMVEFPTTNICNLGKRLVRLEKMLKALKEFYLKTIASSSDEDKIIAIEYYNKCVAIVQNAIKQLTEKMCA